MRIDDPDHNIDVRNFRESVWFQNVARVHGSFTVFLKEVHLCAINTKIPQHSILIMQATFLNNML